MVICHLSFQGVNLPLPTAGIGSSWHLWTWVQEEAAIEDGWMDSFCLLMLVALLFLCPAVFFSWDGGEMRQCRSRTVAGGVGPEGPRLSSRFWAQPAAEQHHHAPYAAAECYSQWGKSNKIQGWLFFSPFLLTFKQMFVFTISVKADIKRQMYTRHRLHM